MAVMRHDLDQLAIAGQAERLGQVQPRSSGEQRRRQQPQLRVMRLDEGHLQLGRTCGHLALQLQANHQVIPCDHGQHQARSARPDLKALNGQERSAAADRAAYRCTSMILRQMSRAMYRGHQAAAVALNDAHRGQPHQLTQLQLAVQGKSDQMPHQCPQVPL